MTRLISCPSWNFVFLNSPSGLACLGAVSFHRSWIHRGMSPPVSGWEHSKRIDNIQGVYGAYFSKLNYHWSKSVRNKFLAKHPFLEVVLVSWPSISKPPWSCIDHPSDYTSNLYFVFPESLHKNGWDWVDLQPFRRMQNRISKLSFGPLHYWSGFQQSCLVCYRVDISRDGGEGRPDNHYFWNQIAGWNLHPYPRCRSLCWTCHRNRHAMAPEQEPWLPVVPRLWWRHELYEFLNLLKHLCISTLTQRHCRYYSRALRYGRGCCHTLWSYCRFSATQ